MPVDGGMIPMTQSLLPWGVVADRMVNGGGGIGTKHAKEIEDDPYPRPVAIAAKYPYQKNDADNDTQQDAATMRSRIPNLLFLSIPNHALSPFEYLRPS